MKQIIKRIVTVLLILAMLLPGANCEEVLATSNVASCNNGNEQKCSLKKEEVPCIMDYENTVEKGHISREKSRENGLDEVVFKNKDGSYTMYIYDQNVKFVDKDGEIKDIDTGIEIISKNKQKGYTYTNGQNCVNVDFPDCIDDGIIIDDNNMKIKMYPIDNICGKIIIEDDTAVYEDAYGEGTKLIYTPTLNGVKEEIVLDEYNGKEKYVFIYEIGDGYIKTLDDDCLYIYSDDDEYVGLIEPIYMLDAENKYNADSKMNYYENEDGTWTVEVVPNKEFLTSKDTVYPVIIDPTYTVNVANNSTGIQDVTINSTSTSAGYSGSLFVGNRSNTENGISRVMMKIVAWPVDMPSSIEIQSATVTLRDIMCESASMTIDCCQAAGATTWNESNASWSAAGGNSCGEIYDSQVVSYSNGVNNSHVYSFDITVAVKEWLNNETKMNQGLLFKAKDESIVRNKTFASYQRASYQPTFSMTYVENNAAFTWSYLSGLRGYSSNSGHIPPNCAGYALGLNIWIDSATDNFSPDLTSISNFADSFSEYVNGYVSNREIVKVYSGDWRKLALASNQYLIAARICSTDFHFMVQTNDGKWTQKSGSAVAVTPSYYNPTTTNWNSKYTSSTIYMVVEIN